MLALTDTRPPRQDATRHDWSRATLPHSHRLATPFQPRGVVDITASVNAEGYASPLEMRLQCEHKAPSSPLTMKYKGLVHEPAWGLRKVAPHEIMARSMLHGIAAPSTHASQRAHRTKLLARAG